MIYCTLDKNELEKLFNGRVPYFECEDKTLSNDIVLFDMDEIDDYIVTTLYICDYGFFVTVEQNADNGETYVVNEQYFDDFTDAYNYYKTQAGENTSGINR